MAESWRGQKDDVDVAVCAWAHVMMDVGLMPCPWHLWVERGKARLTHPFGVGRGGMWSTPLAGVERGKTGSWLYVLRHVGPPGQFLGRLPHP